MLLQKLMSGLSDVALHREVLQLCDSFQSVESLRKYCVAFELTQCDADFGWEIAVVEHHSALPDLLEDAKVAATCRNPSPVGRPCGNCGGSPALGKSSCLGEVLVPC